MRSPEIEPLIQDINDSFSTYSIEYEKVRKKFAQRIALLDVKQQDIFGQILNNVDARHFEIKEDEEDVISSIISRLSTINDFYLALIRQQNKAMASVEDENKRLEIYIYFEKLKYILQQARLQYRLLVDQYLDADSQPYAFFDKEKDYSDFDHTARLLRSGDSGNSKVQFLDHHKYDEIKRSLGGLEDDHDAADDIWKNLQLAVGIFYNPRRVESDRISEVLTKLNAIALKLHELHARSMFLMEDPHRRAQISHRFQILKNIVDKSIINCHVKLFPKQFTAAVTPANELKIPVDEKSQDKPQAKPQTKPQKNVAEVKTNHERVRNNLASPRARALASVIAPRREPWYKRIASAFRNFKSYCKNTPIQRKFLGYITGTVLMTFVYYMSSIGSMIGGPYGSLISLLASLGIIAGCCIIYTVLMGVMYLIEKSRRNPPPLSQTQLLKTDPSENLNPVSIENIKSLKARISKTTTHSIKLGNKVNDQKLKAAEERAEGLKNKNEKLKQELKDTQQQLQAERIESARLAAQLEIYKKQANDFQNLKVNVQALASYFSTLPKPASSTSHHTSTSTSPRSDSDVAARVVPSPTRSRAPANDAPQSALFQRSVKGYRPVNVREVLVHADQQEDSSDMEISR